MILASQFILRLNPLVSKVPFQTVFSLYVAYESFPIMSQSFSKQGSFSDVDYSSLNELKWTKCLNPLVSKVPFQTPKHMVLLPGTSGKIVSIL